MPQHVRRVVSLGGGPGTDIASLLWISRHFFRSRAIQATLLGEETVEHIVQIACASAFHGLATCGTCACRLHVTQLHQF
jgi:hypothetical protein